MKDELLLRLESFEIDQPRARFPFSARLARENGWSRPFARRVVAEYKRFLWLAAKAGHPVTPSEEVDEAWHLHLCHTRSYWDELCGEILRKPLHHGPTEGGAVEEQKFANWYEHTLESYRHHFGEEPPADIWPPAEQRFRPVETRKVDPREHWIVPRKSVRRGLAGTALLASVCLLVGCAGTLALTDFGTFVVMLFVFAIAFTALVVVLSSRSGKSKDGNGSGCSAGGSGSSGCGYSSSRGNESSNDSGSSSDSASSGCGSSGCGGGCGGGGD